MSHEEIKTPLKKSRDEIVIFECVERMVTCTIKEIQNELKAHNIAKTLPELKKIIRTASIYNFTKPLGKTSKIDADTPDDGKINYIFSLLNINKKDIQFDFSSFYSPTHEYYDRFPSFTRIMVAYDSRHIYYEDISGKNLEGTNIYFPGFDQEDKWNLDKDSSRLLMWCAMLEYGKLFESDNFEIFADRFDQAFDHPLDPISCIPRPAT